MTRRYLLLLLLLTIAWTGSAQIVLQMEKFGKARTTKFQLDEEITYRLKDDPTWYTGYIDNLNSDQQSIIFHDRFTKIDQIDALRSYHPQSWSKPAAYGLYTFGTSWTLFSALAPIVDKSDSYTWGDAAVLGTSFATGFLIQQLFKHKTYRMGKKRRLRVVDLRIN